MTVPAGFTMLPWTGLWKQGDPSGPYVLNPDGTTYLPGQGNVAGGTTDSGNPIKVGGVYNTALPTYTNGQRTDLQSGTRGGLHVNIMSKDGTTGAACTALSEPISTTSVALYCQAFGYVYNTTGSNWEKLRGDLTSGVYVQPKGATAGGLSAARVLTGTTGVIKAAAGQLYTLRGMNTNAAARYLHLYDKATAPTLSTDTPIFTIPLQASSVPADLRIGDIGLAFANGIAWAYTTDDIAIPATAATSTELHFSAAYK